MDIVISNASQLPIYEQITSQVKALIMNGELAAGEQLPSIRSLANSLRVSVITTKRAYGDLEAQGFIETVPGKGCFVAGANSKLIQEEQLRSIEDLLAKAIERARIAKLSPTELHDMLDTLLENQ